MSNIGLLKFIDLSFGRLAVSLLQSAQFCHSGVKYDTILIIRPGGIGDAVLLLPALTRLKQLLPQSRLSVLAEKRNAAVFAFCSAVDRVLLYDRPRELFTAIRGSYDVVIDTEQWHRLSAVVARLTRAPIMIGFGTNERRKLFTHAIPYSHDDYELISFQQLLAPITDGIAGDAMVPFLTVPQDALGKASRLLFPLSNREIVALFPGGTVPERRWGTDRFHGAARMLSERGFGIVAVGGRQDARAGEEILRDIPDSLNLCGKLTLPETAAVLEQSSLLITGDSGIMHIGYGLGTKMVALFGPGRERKWAPRGEDCIVINKHLSCSPCTSYGNTPRCSKNAECMRQITVDEVLAASLALLKK